ncbi:MAG TPA: amidohydrolase family protein [Candidatus Aquilonibacter sp.]
MPLALERIDAIDVHVHAWAPGAVDEDPMLVQAAKYFGDVQPPKTLDDMAAYYRERRMACVVFTVDGKNQTRAHVSNDDVLAFAARNGDVVIPFVSVDPTRGAAGVREAERLIATGNVRGFKLHPQTQAFFANDPAIYPFYEVIEAAKLPIIVHTGHSGMGTGMRGGGGIRLKYGNPMLLDDVAVDFPDMPIILAHPSFPWQDEALSVCLHKPQVYIDLSGWSPKYFPPNLIQYANTQLKHKVLFGSDYPVLTPDRWMRDFAALPIKDDVRPLILRENAMRLFGLA